MPGTIFDLIEDRVPEGKEGFMHIAKNAPEPKDNSFLSQVRDYGKTILKGSVEGLERMGSMMGGMYAHPKIRQQELEQQTQQLDEMLPTDEAFNQSALRRGLREAPTMMSFPGSPVQAFFRSIGAGYAGETAKELGAPEWLQTAAELTAYIGPDITKKLLEKGSNAELIEYARKFGMSDEAITPLLQSETKTKWLSKLTPRRGKTQEALSKTKSELSKAYESIQKSPEAVKGLSEQAQTKMMSEFKENLLKMPSSVRKKILPDLRDLFRAPVSGESLINFFADINHELGTKTKQLSLLKKSVKDALSSISPELGKDFEMINKLYTKFYPIASKLKPNLMTDIMGASEALGTLFGVVTGNYGILTKIAGEKTARELAKNLLLNPRFQQIGDKIVEAANQNKYGIVKKLSDIITKEVNKFSPEIAEKLSNISEDEIKDLFTNYQKNKSSKESAE